MLSASRGAGCGMQRILRSKFGSQPLARLAPVGIFSLQKRTMVTDEVIHSTDTLGRWTGGRESMSGIVATVFGAGGLVGKHIVARLARIGSHVIVPYRDDGHKVRELKCLGALGKVNLLPLDMTDEATIQRAVSKSNVVINLIGADVDTRNYSIRDTNVHVAHRIAKISAATGNVERFIHLSAEGADLNSESVFYSSKAEGEEVVRQFFPNATIMRPNTIFGVHDKFISRLGHLCNYTPFMPTFRGGHQKCQPVWVNDVAQSVINSLYDFRSQGKTYHIFGPEKFTQKQLNDYVVETCLNGGNLSVDISSEKLLNFYGWMLDLLPVHGYRLLSKDLVKRMKTDCVPPTGPDVMTHEHLGVEPSTLADKARFILEGHIGDRRKSYQDHYGVEHSRLNRNPMLRHPDRDAIYDNNNPMPTSAYAENTNHYDGVMPDGSRLPNGKFDWEEWQKKNPEMEYVKRIAKKPLATSRTPKEFWEKSEENKKTMAVLKERPPGGKAENLRLWQILQRWNI